MHSRIADYSYLGKVASINLDFDARIEQDQFPDFNFLPAYTTAPPANSAASARQISQIFDSESLSDGMQHLGICILFKSINDVIIFVHVAC